MIFGHTFHTVDHKSMIYHNRNSRKNKKEEMSKFGLKVEHVCSLQTNHLQPVKLCGKGNTHSRALRAYFIYTAITAHSTFGRGLGTDFHIFSYCFELHALQLTSKSWHSGKLKFAVESCFVTTRRVKRFPKGHCQVCATCSNSSHVSLLLEKKNFSA